MSKRDTVTVKTHKGSFFHVGGFDLAILKGLDVNKCLPSVIHHRGLGRLDQSSFSGSFQTSMVQAFKRGAHHAFVVRQG